jgi:hypothetical protein
MGDIDIKVSKFLVISPVKKNTVGLEYLPIICEDLGLIPSTGGEKKKEKPGAGGSHL